MENIETIKAEFRFSPHPNQAHRINWQPWGELAFHKARTEDKLILLDISAVWCHWCHVMDETAYSDEGVIDIINQHYVPIRVDNDRRPDINARYNLGGWPTTAILTPEGDLLGGGTYFPAREMSALLEKMRRLYQEKREALNAQLAEIAVEEARALAEPSPGGVLSLSIYDEILQAVMDAYDFTYGGFGHEPKFPQTDALELVMEAYAHSRDPKYMQVFHDTLAAMYRGGMYDHVEGGFFRYSTTRDWSVPHYEKMLEDHAGLLRNYLHAYALTQNETFKAALDKTFDYLLAALWDEEKGYFYGSQDADEEYYKQNLEERKQRKAPYVDQTLYVSWNAKISAALWEASGLLGEAKYAEAAKRVLDFLWAKSYNESAGFCRYWDGLSHEGGFLSDQLFVALAEMEAYRQTLERVHLERAEKLGGEILARHWDLQQGGCFDLAAGSESLGRLRVRQKDFLDNAAFAHLLLELYRTSGRQEWRDKAQSVLTVLIPHYKNFGAMGSNFALAVKSFVEGGPQIHLLGKEDDPEMQQLSREARKVYLPFKTINLLHPERDAARIAKEGYAANGHAKAYLCLGPLCKGPFKAGELEAALKSW